MFHYFTSRNCVGVKNHGNTKAAIMDLKVPDAVLFPYKHYTTLILFPNVWKNGNFPNIYFKIGFLQG